MRLARLDDVRLHVAQRLEAGAWDGPAARALSSAWGIVSARGLARPLVWPAGVALVAVGGATLGGSGKTPLAIACARELAKHARVAFIAHGYGSRARPSEPRVVLGRDSVANVGDEALVAARALAGVAQVVVAQTRQAAVDHAARFADVLVVDGVLQTSPRRATLSLLALDAHAPWGTGSLPPAGDLRAPADSLVKACDERVLLEPDAPGSVSTGDGQPLRARVTSRGAHSKDGLLSWSDLAPLRLGLFTALARPQRIVATLARQGLTPAHVVSFADHTPPPHGLADRLAALGCDLWLASPKCATALETSAIPHAILDHCVELPGSLCTLLANLSRIAAPALSHDAPPEPALALTLAALRR